MIKEILVFPRGDFYQHVRVLSQTSYAELRLDVHAYELNQFETLTKQPVKWVVSFRNAEQLKYLDFFLSCKISYIDIDVSLASQALFEKIKSSGVTALVSFHQNGSPPEMDRLRKLWQHLKEFGADVIKMVFQAKSVVDNQKIRFLYHLEPRLVAFNMGMEGRDSRLYAAMHGERMIYLAPDGYEPLVEGQWTVSEWNEIKRNYVQGKAV